MSNAKNPCEKIRPLLVDRAMGQLDAATLAAVEQHVAACPQCRSYAEELAATDCALASAPSVAPSEGFDARLAERLRTERDRKETQRVALFAAFAAGLQRLRRFELGVAVYPLALLCVAYVIWALATRQPQVRPSPEDDTIAHGRSIIWPYARHVKEPEVASKALAAIEESATHEERPAAGSDAFIPMLPEPTFSESLIAVQVPREVRSAQKEPETVAELVEIPDPPARPVVMVLPTGAPSGSALARARFRRIKNSRMTSARRSISRGVIWLCRNQDRKGFWAPGGAAYSPEEVTAAAALAMMESGFTPSGKSRVSKHLRAALTWLISRKRPDGMLAAPGPRQWHGHATACIALSEALRLSDGDLVRKRFKPRVQSAVSKLAQGQSATGAWGNEDAELTALVVMAAGSARAAGLAVDATAHASRLAWLESFGRRKSTALASHDVTYTAGQSRSYGVIGVVLGSPEGSWSADREAKEMVKTLTDAPVLWGAGDFFRWYAGTLAAYELSGPPWLKWRRKMLEDLLRHQQGALRSKTTAANRGSWIPHGSTREGGRAYSTAMAVLTLTASYGHSPLYGGTR